VYLQSIKLTYFKNYETAALDFSPSINYFVGRNGMGKTNMLDAIYYLCMCKSNFGLNDRNVSMHGQDFFRIEGSFLKNTKKEKIVAKVQPGKKKEIERNEVAYKKLMEHIGLLPVVMIVPDDTLLVSEGSEARRRFLDNTLSQMDATYLKALLLYNKVLKQRNAALKEFGFQRTYNAELIQIYNEQLLIPANFIFEKRREFISHFEPLFNEYHQMISGGQESMSLHYHSQLNNAAYDAQYELLKKEKKENPILLLDDIFDKLDNDRVRRLIELLVQKEFGQIFITDTHEKRLQDIIEKLQTDYKQFKVDTGTVL